MLLKAVLLYESADNVLTKAPVHFAAHWARAQEFHARGVLLMIGTFGDPQEQGAMGVFTDREAAEEFANEDPFILNGVIRRWEIRDWNEGLVTP